MLGAEVRKTRQRRGLLQAQLAGKVGVDQTTLSRYETGRLNIPDDVLAEIVCQLNCPELAKSRCRECAVGRVVLQEKKKTA